MSEPESRILFSPPPHVPKKVFESGKEGYAPYHCIWEDGSYYRSWWAHGQVERDFAGKMFDG